MFISWVGLLLVAVGSFQLQAPGPRREDGSSPVLPSSFMSPWDAAENLHFRPRESCTFPLFRCFFTVSASRTPVSRRPYLIYFLPVLLRPGHPDFLLYIQKKYKEGNKKEQIKCWYQCGDCEPFVGGGISGSFVIKIEISKREILIYILFMCYRFLFFSISRVFLLTGFQGAGYQFPLSYQEPHYLARRIWWN